MTKPVRPTGVPPSGARRRSVAPDDTAPVDLLELVKRAYVYYRRRWERLKSGRDATYDPPRSYDGLGAVTIENEVELRKGRPSEWGKLYTFCRKNKIDPVAYIAVAFDSLTHEPSRAPEPFQLCGEHYLKVWLRGSKALPQRIAEAAEIQRETATTEIVVAQMYAAGGTAEDAYARVLLNDSLPLSALFRYCVAKSLTGDRFSRIAQQFEAEAVLQFQPYAHHYRKHWKALLPKGFAALAARTFPGLLLGS